MTLRFRKVHNHLRLSNILANAKERPYSIYLLKYLAIICWKPAMSEYKLSKCCVVVFNDESQHILFRCNFPELCSKKLLHFTKLRSLLVLTWVTLSSLWKLISHYNTIFVILTTSFSVVYLLKNILTFPAEMLLLLEKCLLCSPLTYK